MRGQIQALRALTPLRQVKPHGGLYNLAARDAGVARVVAEAVREVDASLVLFGLAGSELLRAGRSRRLAGGRARGLPTAPTRRTVRSPRGAHTGALLDVAAAVAQVLGMVRTGKVRTTDGSEITVQADTVCIMATAPRRSSWHRHCGPRSWPRGWSCGRLISDDP